MSTISRGRGRLGAATAAVAVCVAVVGCGASSVKITSVPAGTTVPGSGSNSGSMPGMDMSADSSGSGTNVGGSSKGMSVGGIKAVATQTLATASWQDMAISARAMTAVPFMIFNGTHERTVKPPKDVSFHMMIMLSDARTKVPIPYASVWATIRKKGKIVYDERQWPMLSEYMGPHYGNDVSLPGAGSYQLSLLISPPVSARHMEYDHVWLKPHRVTMSFSWKPST